MHIGFVTQRVSLGLCRIADFVPSLPSCFDGQHWW